MRGFLKRRDFTTSNDIPAAAIPRHHPGCPPAYGGWPYGVVAPIRPVRIDDGATGARRSGPAEAYDAPMIFARKPHGAWYWSERRHLLHCSRCVCPQPITGQDANSTSGPSVSCNRCPESAWRYRNNAGACLPLQHKEPSARPKCRGLPTVPLGCAVMASADGALEHVVREVGWSGRQHPRRVAVRAAQACTTGGCGAIAAAASPPTS